MADDNEDGAEVVKLRVRFKHPTPEDRSVLLPYEVGKRAPCMHSPLFGACYVVDEKLAEVECSVCGAKLNPVWAMAQLARQDLRMHEAARRYQEEMKRLDERRRTKCDSCGKMTRITRR